MWGSFILNIPSKAFFCSTPLVLICVYTYFLYSSESIDPSILVLIFSNEKEVPAILPLKFNQPNS